MPKEARRDVEISATRRVSPAPHPSEAEPNPTNPPGHISFPVMRTGAETPRAACDASTVNALPPCSPTLVTFAVLRIEYYRRGFIEIRDTSYRAGGPVERSDNVRSITTERGALSFFRMWENVSGKIRVPSWRGGTAFITMA
eukprot:643847-Prorocentrum_minimum.AAC.1